ncbi:MAG: hypothetical protein SO362_05865 [Selenomonas montiformis]|nr:hypothetical protein [Selenomonas montiformis]
MLNAGFQYLEQRDANDTITKNGVVSKNSPFATSDNSGIYDVIAENFRAIKDMLDTVSSSNDLSSIRDEVKTMYDDMRTNEKFGSIEATEQAAIAKEQAAIATEKAKEAAASLTSINDSSKDISADIKTINDSISAVKTYLDTIQSVQKDVADNAQVATNQKTAAKQAADKASTSETNAASSAASSAASASAAKDSETNAKTSETNAKASAFSAASSAESAQNAKDSAESIKDTVMSLKSGAEKAISDHNNAMTANSESMQETLSLTNQAYNKANDSASTAEMWAEGDVPSENVTGDDGTVTVVAHKSSKGWATESKSSAESSAASADNASKSASEAHEYLDTVATNASKAESSATAAKQSEDNALSHADGAKTSESNAKASETNASTYANTSKAWAMSGDSPDGAFDADADGGKTMSSKTWAIKAKSSAQSALDNAKESKENANNVATALQNMQAVQSNILSIQEQIKKLEEEANKCLSDAQSIRDSISSSVVYKGSVDTYTALPTSNKVGDMYNIAHADSDHGIKAGDNVIWNGTDWDNTGGTIDTSTFAQIGSDVSFGTVTATTFKGKADAAKVADSASSVAWSNVTGKPTSMTANGGSADTAKVADSAKICTGNSASASSVPWSGVTGKPGTYPPSAHNHDSAYPSVTGTRASGTWGINISGNAANATNAANANKLASESGSNYLTINTTTNSWSVIGSNPGNWLKSIRTDGNAPAYSIGNYSAAIAFGGADTKGIITHAYGSPDVKFAGGNGSTASWKFTIHGGYNNEVYDLNNFPTKTGGGASGTWGINITGNANTATSVAWSGVTGKPSTFAPASHSHSWDATTGKPGGIVKVAGWDGSTLSLTTCT